MLIAILCTSTSATAYDFEIDGIAYTITSLTDLTVCVDHLTKDTSKIKRSFSSKDNNTISGKKQKKISIKSTFNNKRQCKVIIFYNKQ